MRAAVPVLRRAALAIACAATCSVAVALPDLGRGMVALQRGDVAAAEADLLPLAESGYVEAQIGLARLYGAQDGVESQRKAVRWYRVAASKDRTLRVPLARSMMRSGVADPAEIDQLLQTLVRENQREALPMQLRLYREFPQLAPTGRAAVLAQDVAGSKLPEERAEAIAWYRVNRMVQPAYAEALATLCEKDRKFVEECYADLTRHFRAVNDQPALVKLRAEVVERFDQQQLSADTLERVARNLAADDQAGKPATEAAYALLSKIAKPSPTVTARKARLLIANPNLDPDADPEALLKSAYAEGSVEAAVQLGRLYLDEFSPVADPARAEALLTEAAKTQPSADTWLGRLYERGYLGLPDAPRALEHYLRAARAGFPNADIALARMYTANRGIRVDAVQALGFARLAEHGGHPGAAEFLAQLLPTMTADEIARGQRLAQAELTARSAAAVPQDAARVAAATEQTP